MFRSSTILRELVQSMAKVTLALKHSVKLRRRILCGDVTACREMACVLFVVLTDTEYQSRNCFCLFMITAPHSRNYFLITVAVPRDGPAAQLSGATTLDITGIMTDMVSAVSFPRAKEFLRKLSAVLAHTLKKVGQPYPRPKKV